MSSMFALRCYVRLNAATSLLRGFGMPEQLDVATANSRASGSLGALALAPLDEQAALGSVAPGDARERACSVQSRRSVQSHSTDRVWWSGADVIKMVAV